MCYSKFFSTISSEENTQQFLILFLSLNCKVMTEGLGCFRKLGKFNEFIRKNLLKHIVNI